MQVSEFQRCNAMEKLRSWWWRTLCWTWWPFPSEWLLESDCCNFFSKTSWNCCCIHCVSLFCGKSEKKKNSCFWLWSFVRFVVIMLYYELVELINFYVNDLFVGPIVCGHDLPKLKKCKMWRVRTRGSILHSKDLAILIYTNVIYSHNINEK